MTTKEYRHNDPVERQRVVSVIQRVWGQITAASQPLDVSFNTAATAAALARLGANPLDGPDAFLVEAMLVAGVTQILTDDGDFCCVPGIEVFTANPRVLTAARATGLLHVR